MRRARVVRLLTALPLHHGYFHFPYYTCAALLNTVVTKSLHSTHNYTQPSYNPSWVRKLRHTALQVLILSPLLLLEPHQLAVPALSLLPLNPTSISLMYISQLPHVMAASQTPCSLTAAETLSTLVATAWAKYIARLETTEPDLGLETVYTVTGGTSSNVNKFCIQTINIQGGITDADKIMAIQDVVRKYEPDAMAISEAGKNCRAETLRWLNKSMNENTSISASTYLASSDAYFSYTITSACTESDHERGGIVLLLHNKWRHRVVGKPIIDRNGRWICTDVRTPRGRTSLIAAYLPPSPQHSKPAKQAWANLQDFVISRHSKNRLVYLFGDLNAFSNNPLHRNNTGSGHYRSRPTRSPPQQPHGTRGYDRHIPSV